MNQDDERLEPILRRLGLIQCPDCCTPITAENIGWNPDSEHGDPLPIVYIACKPCNRRLKVFHIQREGTAFARSRDDAIEELNEISGGRRDV